MEKVAGRLSLRETIRASVIDQLNLSYLLDTQREIDAD